MSLQEKVAGFVTANKAALKFVGSFALVFAGLYLLFGLTPGIRAGLIKPYTGLLARAVAAVINLFGAAATVEGSMVHSSRFSIDIVMGCDGIEASCLFAAGVLAFPASWRSKIIGLAIGVPLIHLINLARLIGLYYAGVYVPSGFEELHVYVAQTIVILLSTGILIFWLDRFAVQRRAS
jgi:exosortase H (IPTLxxWG-CTERM-specific)